MKKVTDFVTIYLLTLLILLGSCGKDSKTVLKSAYWVYVNNNYDSSYWTNSYAKFSDSMLNICRASNMKYRLSEDSLWIYLLEDNTIKYQDVLQKIYSFKIISISNDSLILLTSDELFPYYFTGNIQNHQDTIKFVNLLSIEEKPSMFQKISFAGTTCFGSCPDLLFEVNSNGTFKEKCGAYNKRKGEFSGQLNSVEMQLLQRRLSNVPLIEDSIGSDTPIDAPDLELIIAKNKQRHVFFGGHTFRQHDLFAIYEDLIHLSDNVPATPKKDLKFEAGFSPSLHAPTPVKFISPSKKERN